MKLNPDSTDAEFAAFDAAAVRNGRNDLLRLSHGVRMLRDGNRLTDPIAVADRLLLAMDSFSQAKAEAAKIAKADGDAGPSEAAIEAATSLHPQFVGISRQCFERFDSERRKALASFKSGPQQLKSARATLKKLDRLRGRYTSSPLREEFDSLWRYWSDQAALLQQYE